MSAFFLTLIAVLYLLVAANEIGGANYFKAGIVFCYAVANVLLIFVKDV